MEQRKMVSFTKGFISQICLGLIPDWKGAGAIKKYLRGDWTNHLSVPINHRLTSTDQI